MSFLALDLGRKRTGVALSQSGRLVTPVGTLPTLPRKKLVAELRSLINRYQVTTVLVGDAGLASVGVLDQQPEVWLQELLGVAVVVRPEFASTEQARQRTGRRDHADTEAACTILEQYLEEHEATAV